jgi:hypothetical protein
MAAPATARRDVMVVCLQEGFKACDALIWTVCHQDVMHILVCFVNFWILPSVKIPENHMIPRKYL